MRGLKDSSMMSLMTVIGITSIVLAQLEAGCFTAGTASCSAWYTLANPYPSGVSQAADCTHNACGCSGDPAVPAGEENPSECGCFGVVTVHINTPITGAFPCPVGVHNGCKDNWTIKVKGNGEPDSVECGIIKSCNSDCEPQPIEGPNGEPIFGQNICGPPATSNPIIANQAEVIGDPC